MPIYSAFAPKHNLVITVLQSTIQPDDIQYNIHKYARTREFQQANNYLLDTQLVSPHFALQEILPVVLCYGSVHHQSRVAIVVSQRLEQAISLEKDCWKANLNAIVFDTLHPACTWLGLSLLETTQSIRRILKKA